MSTNTLIKRVERVIQSRLVDQLINLEPNELKTRVVDMVGLFETLVGRNALAEAELADLIVAIVEAERARRAFVAAQRQLAGEDDQ